MGKLLDPAGLFGRDKKKSDDGAAERARQVAEDAANKENARLKAIEDEEAEQRKRGKRGARSLLTGDRTGFPTDDETLGAN